MKVLLIEDEHFAAQNLKDMILEIDPNIQVLAILDSVKKSIEWLLEHSPDLIISDIQLADDISFTIFEKINIKVPIIFTTAYNNYAIRAFKLNSIDYLLKPINKIELEIAINKYKELHSKPELNIEKLMDSFRNPKEFQKRFIVTEKQKIKSVTIEEIAYFFAQEKYVFLITKSNVQHLVDYTIDKLEQILDPEVFFRVNRKFIIHFDSIKNMYQHSKSRIRIEVAPVCSIEIIVSIERSGSFKNWLNR